jgi:hypothetical protein
VVTLDDNERPQPGRQALTRAGPVGSHSLARSCSGIVVRIPVFIVLAYGDTQRLYGPVLVRKFSTHGQRSGRSELRDIGYGRIAAQLRSACGSGSDVELFGMVAPGK